MSESSHSQAIEHHWPVITDQVVIATRNSRYAAVTEAPKGEFISSPRFVSTGKTVKKAFARTRNSSYKGRYQDIKPTERTAINRVTRKASTQNIWSF